MGDRVTSVPRWERDLVLRLLSTLLREDVAGLRSRGRLVVGRHGVRCAPPTRRAGVAQTCRGNAAPPQRDRRRARQARQARQAWLAFGRLRIPVRAGDPESGDLLSDLVPDGAFVVRAQAGRWPLPVTARRLLAVLNLVAGELIRALPGDKPAGEFRDGFAALGTEAEAALAGAELRARRRPTVLGRLRSELAGAAGLGWAGAIGYETLAAHRDHPLYPFSLARVGLLPATLPAFAPEHRPQLALRWLTLPGSAVQQAGRLPDWWPTIGQADDIALPVHPATPRHLLATALREAGFDPTALLRNEYRKVIVRPTLSLRTVAPRDHPGTHLKLPLPVSTLGRLNLRVISRTSLADGVLTGDLLRALLRDAPPQFTETILVPDESTWLHAGHSLLAALVRRWPGDLSGSAIVPVAGLTAPGPTGLPVISVLAQQFWDGDLGALIDDYLRTVIGWQVMLWLRYGITLEAHQQNVLIAVDRTTHGPRLRLLLRDLDSALVDLDLIRTWLGDQAPKQEDFSDPRLIVHEPRQLADLFVTTTLHQCIASVLVETGVALGLPVRRLLDQVRPLLAEAADQNSAARDVHLLTEIATAARLPVKRALTAATLLPKTRTGASDVNKYYGADAPSYL